MTADSPAAPRRRAEVLALPGFDEYLLGYSDRSRQLAPEHASRIVPGANGIFLPTIVAAGRVIGTWRRTVTNGIVGVVPEPFEDLTPTQSRSFGAASKRYREFCAN